MASSVSMESRSSSVSPAGVWQGKQGLCFYLASACSGEQMLLRRERAEQGSSSGGQAVMLPVCIILGGV